MNKNRLLAGLFLFFAIVITMILILLFGRFGSRFQDTYTIWLKTPNAEGIIKGTEVKLRGASIGSVSSDPILTEDFEILLKLDIQENVAIPADSHFSVRSLNFLGDKAIMVEPLKASSASLLKDGDELNANSMAFIHKAGSDLPPAIADLLSEAKDTLSIIRSAFSRIESATAKIDTDVLSDKNRNNLQTSMEHLSKTLKNLEKFSERLEKDGVLKYRSRSR